MTQKPKDLTYQINQLMKAYYEDYYRVQLGLRDWASRVQNRLREEEYLGKPNLDRVEEWMNIDFSGKHVLVVGAGTGAETVILHQRGAKVFAIEPEQLALDILRLKAKFFHIPQDRFKKAVAERIPYKTNSFDFVYCYTVLEHVRDVEKSIDEMIRVCRVGGLVYIQTPDYRFPYEGHYKDARRGFSSKRFTIFQFWLRGKPTRFLHSVNFVNGPNLDKIFMNRNVVALRVMPPWLLEWRRAKASPFIDFASRTGIGKDQFIFLRKLG